MQLGAAEWRWKLGLPALPAFFFLLMLLGIPHSPRWLVSKQRIEEAREVLPMTGEENYEQELPDIIASIDAEHVTRDPLFSWKYRLPIFLAVSIGIFNQLSGINAILYYLNDIFAFAGFSKVSSDLQAVAIGGTNLLFTMLAMSVIAPSRSLSPNRENSESDPRRSRRGRVRCTVKISPDSLDAPFCLCAEQCIPAQIRGIRSLIANGRASSSARVVIEMRIGLRASP
jgi:hypothetical protein